MNHDKAMYIEWLLLMDPLESRENLRDKTIEELQDKFNLCRLKQLDEEMEEAQ
ncbi:TPA: hypothetical protein PI620_002562 [Staphylococcus aureus]|jgi:ribosomal protein L29|uniref:Phage protein n=3 Tax=Staphylococcus TaxID=1279 RepID=M9UUB3_STAAU|nr:MULTISPECIES: hypothetical protein [Staphylococcaceae]HDJ6948853.1 hypothetical protein [Staphylococcus aureus Sa_TPS3150]AGJ70562.1 hypothetical protein [Staphylococcus aureus]AGJ70599.1 hypothetical protein [Staphylococcus epidermidis]AGQ80856.1 hypothetical protein [Staphylococcus cohnii]AMN16493.1 hypothetical protein [Staphylococcus aureus]